MTLLKNEQIPFTCQVSKKYCGGEIENLYVTIDEKVLLTIPISREISELFNYKNKQKIKRVVLSKLKELHSERLKYGI